MTRIMTLGSFVLFCAASASAQTTGTATSSGMQTTKSPAAQTITMTGCVGSMSGSSGGYMLSNPMVVPSSTPSTNASTTGTTPTTPMTSPTVTPPPATATQPTGTAGTAGTTGTRIPGTTGSATGTTGAPGTVGTTAGTVGTTGTASTAGTASTTSTPGTAGALGTPGTSGTSGLNGYRLSGTDMTSWSGQRVQIVGTVAPSANGTSTTSRPTASGSTMPEFRVQSVTPVTGSCPR